jgi:Uri superfamily endonuclease
MDQTLERLLADDPATGLALLADSGVYQLLIEVVETVVLQMGRLGAVEVESGYYLYTGSAKRGLCARLARHLRDDKKLRWHIDYLLAAGSIVQIRAFPWRQGRECELNLQLSQRPGLSVPIPWFGSSDCRCPAHLLKLSIDRNARPGMALSFESFDELAYSGTGEGR